MPEFGGRVVGMQICQKFFSVENYQLDAPLIWSSQIANYELERERDQEIQKS